MYCTRIFKHHDDKEMKKLIQFLTNNEIEYEIYRPTKKNHLQTTPLKHHYKAIVCWHDVQNPEA